MKDYNTPLSDQDIRDLLRARLMTHNTEDKFNQQIMNMEAKIAFANAPFIAPPLQKEKELLAKLNRHAGNYSG